jgi:hypothetical protein
MRLYLVFVLALAACKRQQPAASSTAAPAASAPSAPKPVPKPAPGNDCGGFPCDGWTHPLTRKQVSDGMQPVKPQISACFEKFKVPGTAEVKLTIESTGRVSQVMVSGKFAKKPTGACVEDAVKTAVFPAFEGAPMTLDYPFMLK